MADTIGVNNLTKIGAGDKTHSIRNETGSAGKLTGNNGRETVYDYSAIKLTDDDKRYRMDIRKQADALLNAADAITNKFPSLFTQMISGYNNQLTETQEMIDKHESSFDNHEYNEPFDVNKAEAKAKIEIEIPERAVQSEQIGQIKQWEQQEPKSNERLDSEGISSVINKFIENINGMMEKAGSSDSYAASSASSRIKSAIDDYSEQLSAIGINHDDEHGIIIDQKRLEESINNGSAEKVLTADKGFTERVSRIAREAIHHSDNFIEKTNPRNDNRPAKNTNINYNYVTNATIDN